MPWAGALFAPPPSARHCFHPNDSSNSKTMDESAGVVWQLTLFWFVELQGRIS